MEAGGKGLTVSGSPWAVSSENQREKLGQMFSAPTQGQEVGCGLGKWWEAEGDPRPRNNNMGTNPQQAGGRCRLEPRQPLEDSEPLTCPRFHMFQARPLGG